LATIRRLRRDARSRDGGVREELVKGAAKTFETFVFIVAFLNAAATISLWQSLTRAHELTALAWHTRWQRQSPPQGRCSGECHLGQPRSTEARLSASAAFCLELALALLGLGDVITLVGLPSVTSRGSPIFTLVQ
jgi:hypothetical protein